MNRRTFIIARAVAITLVIGVLVAMAAVVKANAAVRMTYPGIDARMLLADRWQLREPPGSTVAHDDINPANSIPVVVGPCTFNGSSMTGHDHCIAKGPISFNPMSGNWAVCGTIQTKDGHYNWVQSGTSRTYVPWGFWKLSTHAFAVSGTLGTVDVLSGLDHSDGVKHYVCGQRVGDTFSIIIDGKVMRSVTRAIGAVDLSGAHHDFMIGGKLEDKAGYVTPAEDALDGSTWNIQIGRF